MRLATALMILLLTAPSVLAATDAPDSSGIESLGDELLEDLAPAKLNDLPQRRQSPAPSSHPLRFNDLGEDIGQPSGSHPLASVRQGMQHAESLLAKDNAAADAPTFEQATRTQQKVVAQLDKLIAELSKQCKNGQCQPSDQPQPSQRSQNKPGKQKNAAAAGKTAAPDSTDRLNQASAKPVDQGDVESLMKDLWGHLPQRTREQMMQSFSEEFLPQYELEIEQYYRRLSEDDDHLGTD